MRLNVLSFFSVGGAPCPGRPPSLARDPPGGLSLGAGARRDQGALQSGQAGHRAGKDRAVGRHVSHGHAGEFY